MGKAKSSEKSGGKKRTWVSDGSVIKIPMGTNKSGVQLYSTKKIRSNVSWHRTPTRALHYYFI